jgi:hypothetical protein
MIQKVFKWLLQPLGRVALLIAALAALSVVIWGIGLTQKTPAQPIEFPHKRHVVLPSRRDARTFVWVADHVEVLGVPSATRDHED